MCFTVHFIFRKIITRQIYLVFVVMCCTACGTAQEETKSPNDLSDSIIGKWTLKTVLYDGKILMDVSDRSKLFRDSIQAYSGRGIPLTQGDSVNIMHHIDQLIIRMHDNYLDFGKDKQFVAKIALIDPKSSPSEYVVNGIYEVDYHRVRIELHHKEDYQKIDPSGSFHWFIRNGDLYLFRNYEKTNESCEIYQRLR